MQSEIKSGYYTLPNIGYYIGKIPLELLSSIRKEIKKIESDMANSSFAGQKLSGNIEKEFDLTDCRHEIEQYVLKLVLDHDYNFNYLKSFDSLNSNVPLYLQNLWVNFQKKHEFNPNHNHTGVMSFVIWVKIPYDLDEEKKLGPGRYSNANQSSLFQFSYTDILGSIRIFDIPVDRNYEGVICMFPNKLTHCVYPFYTSDDYRISVSGNISLKVK